MNPLEWMRWTRRDLNVIANIKTVLEILVEAFGLHDVILINLRRDKWLC